MKRILLTALAVITSACGADEFCDTVECNEAASSTSSAVTGSSSTSDAASGSTTTAAGPGGTGGSGGDGGGVSDGGAGGTGGTGPFEVTPGDTKVGILRALDFDATVDVEWSVAEDDGGTIDDEGVYLSPEEPGTFHVVATSGSGEEIEIELTVVALAVEVAGGAPGGAGNLDGIPSRARFASPRGLGLLDGGASDFLIADTGNHTLRIYREADGEVVTLAGSPGASGTSNGIGAAARFDGPTGVVIDDDVAYVVDGEGTCIRRVETASGDVTTLAGACGTPASTDGASGITSRFTGIQALVADPVDDDLYVCQIAGVGSALRRIDVGTGATTTVALGADTPIADCHLAPDAANNAIYASASWPDRQLKAYLPLQPAQSVIDLVGIPGADAGLAGLALVGGDTVFAFDRERPGGSGTPYETTLHAFELGDAAFVEAGGGDNDYVDGPLSSARFLTPGFFTPTPNGDLLMSDIEAHTIRRIDLGGVDEVETVLGAPASIYAADGSAATGRLLFPFHVALAEDDAAIFVAGLVPDNVIRRIDAETRAITRLSGVPADYVIGSEIDFDLPADGQADVAVFGAILDVLRVGDDLYVIDTSSSLRRVSIETGAVETFAGGLNLEGFEDGFGTAARFDFTGDAFGGGLATDGVDLFVADPGNFAVRKVELATGEVTTIAGGTEGTEDGTGDEAQFVAPAGVAYDDGILYVADVGAHTIRQIDVASGEVTTLTGRAGLPGDANGDADDARFAGPYQLVADGIGSLYVTSTGVSDQLPHKIRRVRLADVETSTFAGDDVLYGFANGPLPATLGCPVGLAIDGAGDLVFTDACDGAIGAIRPL